MSYRTSRLIKCVVMVVGMSLLIAVLPASFGELVKISPERQSNAVAWSFWEGKNALRIENGTIHTAFMHINQNRLPEVAYQQYNTDTGEIALFPLEQFLGLSANGVVLEMTPDGNLIVVHPSSIYETDFYCQLNRYLINPQGEIITRDNRIFPDHFVSQAISHYNDSYHIVLRKGNTHPADHSYHIFSDTTEGFMRMPGYFRYIGGDVIYGRVHHNSDIYIRPSGGQWPIFHGLVTTFGGVRVYPGGGTNYPAEEIFLGGLKEYYYYIPLPSGAIEARREGTFAFGDAERDDAIAYVTVDGSNFSAIIGEIVTEDIDVPDFEWVEGVNRFTVYDSYPPYGEVGQAVAVNQIPRRDTVWGDPIEGNLQNSSIFVPMEMWISGTFSGKQTWASSHNIYLKDNLLYQETIPGNRPDGIDEFGNPTLPVNQTDYLGIVSEKSIYIQYGHRSPIDGQRYKPNTNSIYLYGAYSALGKGDAYRDPWNDGVFSFQYQFPKGSTPPQLYQGERYTNIDLHRFRYPTTANHPWPPGLDYPWYNPLWPEPGEIYGFTEFASTPNPHNAPTITKLRGTINLFGALSQRNLGYTRRAGNRDYDTGIWDIHNVLRPTSPPQYGAPDPHIGPIGYVKNYLYDLRFEHTSPPHFNHTGIFNSQKTTLHYYLSRDGTSVDRTVLEEPIDEYYTPLLQSTYHDKMAILIGNRVLLFHKGDIDYDEYELDIPEEDIVKEIVLYRNELYLLTTNYIEAESIFASKVYSYSFRNETLTLRRENNYYSSIQTIYNFHGNILWAASQGPEMIEIHICNDDNLTIPYRWQHRDVRPQQDLRFWREKSKLVLDSSGSTLVIAFHFRVFYNYASDHGGDIYVAWGEFEFSPDIAVSPVPENEAEDVSVLPAQLGWSYLASPSYLDPVGFKVYLGTEPDFDEESFYWVDYETGREEYTLTSFLPEGFEYDTEYYWMVVPTTIAYNEPEERRTRAEIRTTSSGEKLVFRGDAQNCPVWMFRTETGSQLDERFVQLATRLKQNYPNPFNPHTTISYSIGKEAQVRITVYNLRGQAIRTLVAGVQPTGSYQVDWNGDDDKGTAVSSGLYFLRLQTAEYDKMHKIMLVK